MIIQTRDELIDIMLRKNPGDYYKWRKGFRGANKAEASVVGEYLEEWGVNNGGMATTEDLAADSDRKSSPLYPLVTHDMEKAAHQYRLAEIRTICGAVLMVKVLPLESEDDEEPREVTVRVMSNVVDENGKRGYVPNKIVVKSEDMTEQVIQSLRNEIRLWQHKAREFGIFFELVAAIDDFLDDEA